MTVVKFVVPLPSLVRYSYVLPKVRDNNVRNVLEQHAPERFLSYFPNFDIIITSFSVD